MSSRRENRVAAMQFLYQWSINSRLLVDTYIIIIY